MASEIELDLVFALQVSHSLGLEVPEWTVIFLAL